MIMNGSGKKKKFELFINKLVLSQTRHLHSGRAFNREMHLYGLHNQRRLLLLFVLVFKLSADLFLMSVSWFIVVTRSIHGDCMRRQKAHPKLTGV